MALDDLWGTISGQYGNEGLKIATHIYERTPGDGRQKILEALALSRGLLRILLDEETGMEIGPVDLINTVTGIFYPRADQVKHRILLGRHLSLDLPDEKLDLEDLRDLEGDLKNQDTTTQRMGEMAYFKIFPTTRIKKVKAVELCQLPALEALCAKLTLSLQQSPELHELFERVANDNRLAGDTRANASAIKTLFLDRLTRGLLLVDEYRTLHDASEKIHKINDCRILAKWLCSFGLNAKAILGSDNDSCILVSVNEQKERS